MSGRHRPKLLAGYLTLTFCCLVIVLSGNERLFRIAGNSALLAIGVTITCLPLGTVLSLLLVRTNLPGRRFVLAVGTLLLIIPLYLQAAAWDAGFGRLGWYSLIQETFGSPMLSGWAAVIWIHFAAALPWAVFCLSVLISMAEPALEESALLDGSARQVFLRVTLRRIRPGIWLVMLWVVLIAVSEMTVTDLYGIRTLAEELYTSQSFGQGYFYEYGIRQSLVATALLAAATFVVVVRFGQAPIHIPSRPAQRVDLKRWKWPAAVFVFGIVILLFVLPVGNLIYKAGMTVTLEDGERIRSWSAVKFISLLVPWPGSTEHPALWRFHREWAWTFTIGAAAATTILAAAIPLAWLARYGGWRSVPALTIGSLAVSMSGPLVGITILHLMTLSSDPWTVWLADRTIVGPVVAIAWRNLPLALLITWIAFRTISPTRADAAAVEGAGPLSRCWHVGIRARRHVLALVWLVSFVLACGDLSASILVLPPGITTLPIRVFGLLHYGVDDQVAAICVTNIGAFALLTVLVACGYQIKARRSSDGTDSGN
jgi:iron(III) transport system permease protein